MMTPQKKHATPLKTNVPQKILIVCLGNICRSPLAQGVLQHKLQQAGYDHILVDSAGTGAWHVGEAPDARSCQVAKNHDIDISQQQARQIDIQDFYEFDLILAMDKQNLVDLEKLQGDIGKDNALIHNNKPPAVLALFSAKNDEYKNQKVPDPYYGNITGFEHAFHLIDQMAQSWLDFWMTT